MSKRKIKFHSDTNYQLFDERVSWEYPDNHMIKDEVKRTIEFTGEPVPEKIIDAGEDYGGYWT